MTRSFFTLFFCFIVFSAGAQSSLFTTKEDLNLFCDKVMQAFTERKFSEGIQMFRKRSVLDTVTIKSIDRTMVEQMENLEPYYKKTVGYEFVGETTIKNAVVRRRYLLKFENYFLTVDFVLYNNNSGWTVSNFNYYDNPKELF
jgi:hypothetical protein